MSSKKTEDLPIAESVTAADLVHVAIDAGGGTYNSRGVAMATLASFFGAFAVGTAAILEAVRDMLGSGGLTAGNGLTATFDDPGDSMSLAVNYATVAEIRAGDATNKAINPDALFGAMDEVALSAVSTTVTPDFGAGINFTLAMANSYTIANPTNAEDGMSGVIVVTQDATGSRVATWGSNWRFAGGAASGGVLSTAANAVDVVSYVVINGLVYASIGKAFGA